MKVRKAKPSALPLFEPFILEVTVETEGEARALHAIFNYTGNTDLFKESIINQIMHCIGEHSVGFNDEINNGVLYNDFYRPKV